MSKPRLIAFYLPQFYPTLENDEWWEPGFTEWTNVAKAKPLFKGHDQPRVPRDLGFYDLRVPETREKQVQMASEAGIEGFCYWHYWFAGRRLLDRVFTEVVESGKPDFPFCLCWANHSWYKKTWKTASEDKLLIEQTYLGEEDYVAHFNAMLPAFKDKRYMKVNGRLIFGVYSPLDIPDFKIFKETWNKLAVQNGLSGFYFFGFTFRVNQSEDILKKGFDCVVNDYIKMLLSSKSKLRWLYLKIKRRINLPHKYKYDDYVKLVLSRYHAVGNIHPCINPNFDHSPRSGTYGILFNDSTPEKWGNLCREVFHKVKDREHAENLVFIKAWNEWGEGNYLEPDSKFNHGYLDALRKECQ